MSETVMSQNIDKLAPALLAAQLEMGNAVKDSKNPFFKSKYADLNSIREAAHPSLNKHGVIVLQPMVQKEGKTYVRTMLLHSSGQFMASDTEVVCAKQNDPQSYGSAVSYARRYGLQSFVSLGADDDDSEAAMGRNFTKSAPTAQPAAQEAAPAQTSSFRNKPKAPAKTEPATTSGSDEAWS